MNRLAVMSIAVLLSVPAFSVAAIAQHGSSGGSAGSPPRTTSPPRTGTPPPTSPTMRGSTSQDQTRAQDQARAQEQVREQDRDRVRAQVKAEGEIAGWGLLTDSERLRFQQQMQGASTDAARNQLRNENQETIRQRARDLGISSPFEPGNDQRSAEGYMTARMLTEQERLRFHERMRTATTEQQRSQIREEARVMTQDRARAMGIELPPSS